MDTERLRRIYDYPVYPCPRCGNRSLALKEAAPVASFQCFECEARFQGRGPHPDHPGHGRFPLTSHFATGDQSIGIERADAVLASELFPAEYSPARLRRRYWREHSLRVGCTLLVASLLLLLLVQLIHFIAGVL